MPTLPTISGTTNNAQVNSALAGLNATIGAYNARPSGGTDRIGGVSVNPNVPNANGTPYSAAGAASAMGTLPSYAQAEYGPLGKPLATGPITPGALTPVAPIQIPLAPKTTPTAGVIAGINVGAGINQNLTPEQQSAQDLQQSIVQAKAMSEAVGLTAPQPMADQYQQAYQQNIAPAQQEVNNLKSQIGSITAQANADILSARNQSSAEGGTGGILSAREDAVNRSASIKTLPLAASLAAAQDNLAMAQDYLKTWFSLKSEDNANTYKYKSDQLNAIKDILTAKEQKAWDLQKMAITNAYNAKDALSKTQATLMANAVQQKAPGSVTQAIANATDINGAIAAAGSYGMSASDKADLELKNAQIANTNASAAKTRGEMVPAGTTPEMAQKTLDQLSFLRNTAKSAMNPETIAASGRSGARRTLEGWLVGSTDYTKLVAETNTLKTNMLTMATDPNIKKFFGPQMSNADVLLMTSAGTTLNPELLSPAEMETEIRRIDDLFNRAQTAVQNGLKGQSATNQAITAPDGTQVIITD